MAKTALMKVWNVELGLAVHIKAPNGKYIVIDLGSRDGVSPTRSLWNKNVGYMVITHPHHDHFSDIDNASVFARPDVLWRVKAYSRDELMADVRENERENFRKYCDFCDSYCGTLTSEKDPTTSSPFDGLTAQVFSTNSCDKSNKNNFSAIVVLKLGNAKVVVCGDNEEESFKVLMKDQSFIEAVRDSYVLVTAHHGRESGFYEDFVSLIKPYLTIISDTAKGTTSATDKYEKYTKGWNVYNVSSEQYQSRKCLTTRNDGNISIMFGESDDPEYSGYLQAKIHVD